MKHADSKDSPDGAGHKARQPQRAHEAEELTAKRIRQNAFLRALERCPVITTAAKQVGIARDLHYDWLQDDPTYRPRYQEALQRAGDALEEKALELAVDGWEEPVFHEGRICGTIRKYDTRHIREMLRAARPDKYSPRQEITGKDGQPLYPLEALQEWMRSRAGDDDEEAADGLTP